LEDTSTDGRVLKWIIKKYNWRTRTGFIRLRIETNGGAVLTMVIHLCVLQKRGIFSLAEDLLASKE
jgi:hypothetical protein